ncbi:Aldo/keto reductase [Aspergillus eucalypticola CBS 122712]|uniref:Aldo/keto reductase n=1 Tax=Aspergillus eucalypticola (strain CBS 122712 / IBT 29274) TaxID=1448314 RepID=A0A317UUW6_ASPEC|nr:Aldo/keto reductase [Aspergillus eucalypticola CBS 122712]PWY63850.1 Aldo/keto reductase [Aspergillus eucalypticola CBS 122712]
MSSPTPQTSTKKSPLSHHRHLSPTSSIRISPLQLGGMSLGTTWSDRLGAVPKSSAFLLLDRFYSLGGNFIDTANAYQAGQSEEWIGEWMATRSPTRRSEMVIATKYTLSPFIPPSTDHNTQPQIQQSNFGGNGTKSMRVSIDESLRRLQTTYIDVFYVHAWDYSTNVEELMQSLNHLVAQGKVLYLGISDAPAWVVSKANMYARVHGLRGFSVYQGRYGATCRDLEREVIPLCRDEGMGVCVWGCWGMVRYIRPPNKDSAQKRVRNSAHLLTGHEEQVSLVLDTVAKRHGEGVSVTSVAIAYVLQKTPYLFPIIGGRTVEQLEENVQALSLELTAEDVKDIDAAYPFDLGFPHSFLCPGGYRDGGGCPGPQDVAFSRTMGEFDYVEGGRAIRAVRG